MDIRNGLSHVYAISTILITVNHNYDETVTRNVESHKLALRTADFNPFEN